MNKILSNYNEILKQIRSCRDKLNGKYCEPELIAVSKKFPKDQRSGSDPQAPALRVPRLRRSHRPPVI